MRRLFAIVGASGRWKLALLLGAIAAALAATGFGAYAAASGSNTINACAKTDNGQLRLNAGGECLPSEQAIQWNQTGPPGPPGPPGQTGQPGPPGNTDSTVRHISNFMLDGSSVTTPILSTKGEIGKLSLFCDHDANGGNGTIGFTESSDPTFHARVIFYSPDVPSSPAGIVVADPHATFPWADTPGDNIIFEMLIEDEPGPTEIKPTLTDIHGFVQHFSFGGCAFFVHVDSSEINSGETFTP